MSSISDLVKEKNTLPLGNVYYKEINGKTYAYHQYFLNGNRFTKLVDEDEAIELVKKIKRRKEIKDIIKNIKASEKGLTLSTSANKLTGNVMMGDKVVATFDHGNLISIDEKLAPLSIVKSRSLESFLSLRTIDMSRTNARLLKKALNIHADEDYKVSLYAYALSISDNYWFKPKHSKIKYSDLILKNDIYSDISLRGDLSNYPHQAKLTPEITTSGSFEKGWKYINNEWYLYKNGNNRQLYSEMFAYRFALLIGVDTAKYELDKGYIRSKNFATKYNFEPMAAIANKNEDYDFIFNLLIQIDRDIARDYIKLILFDSVINNVDRHNENLGLLRDKRNGKIISLAPNFDNNLALISTVDSLNSPRKDPLISFFVKFLKGSKEAYEIYKDINLPDIELYQIEEINESIGIEIEGKEDIAFKVFQRYQYLKDIKF